jgi:ribonuclease P protein component
VAQDRPGDFGFPKTRRLLRRRDFLELQSGGAGRRRPRPGEAPGDDETRRRRAGWFVVLLRRRPDGASGRLGIVVPASLGRAVRRNRIRRLVREAWRTRPDLVPRDHDVVVVVTDGEGEWTLRIVVEELALWRRPRARTAPPGSSPAGGGAPARSRGSPSS